MKSERKHVHSSTHKRWILKIDVKNVTAQKKYKDIFDNRCGDFFCLVSINVSSSVSITQQIPCSMSHHGEKIAFSTKVRDRLPTEPRQLSPIL